MVSTEKEVKLLVIVVVYNGMRWINHCLNSVKESTVRSDLFIIDNGSTDGSIQYIKDNFPEAVFQISKENLGFGKANNIGLQYAIEHGYDYVYLLNQDAWVEPDTFSTLIKFSVSHPEFGVVSPIQCNNGMSRLDNNFLDYAVPPQMSSDAVLGKMQFYYETQFVMAAHWLITKDCLLKVGGFSPTFPHYGEDENYLQRVNYNGYKIAILTTQCVVHDRELRNNSKEKTEYKKYIHELIALSNILDKPSKTYLLKIMLKSLFPNRGIKAKYLLKLISSYSSIQRNNILSENSGASFLNEI